MIFGAKKTAESMARENGAPSAAEKGKAKAEEGNSQDKKKRSEDAKIDKDGKPIVNGTKDDDELNEGMTAKLGHGTEPLTSLYRRA